MIRGHVQLEKQIQNCESLYCIYKVYKFPKPCVNASDVYNVCFQFQMTVPFHDLAHGINCLGNYPHGGGHAVQKKGTKTKEALPETAGRKIC